MQKIIYHLHDVCCNHSSLKLEDAIDYSIKHGYKALYWTEHSPITIKCGYQHRRATYAAIKDLKRRIDECNKKYGNKFHIYFGYEIEFNKNNRWYYQKLARDPYCEFLVLGVHFYGDLFKDPWPYPYSINDTNSIDRLKEYKEQFKAGIESGLFSWAPHPEIWLNSWAKWDKNAQDLSKFIIDICLKHNMPIGFNVNFKPNRSEWHYPSIYFWKEVAETNLKAVIESDAHALEKITVEWLDNAVAIAKQYKVEKNIVKTIPINWLPKKPLLVLYEDGLDKNISKSMYTTLIKNKVKLVKVDCDTNLEEVCKSNNVNPVWTLGIFKSNKLIKEAKKTPMFVIADKDGDMKIKELAAKDYDQFLESFICEIY